MTFLSSTMQARRKSTARPILNLWTIYPVGAAVSVLTVLFLLLTWSPTVTPAAMDAIQSVGGP